MKNEIVDILEIAWTEPIVFRRDSFRASGGSISRKYLANLDSQGKGPEGKAILNGKVCYPADNFFQWLRGRIKA